MICGGKKIKKGICGGNTLYSGASPVTYYVDTNIAYTEEVDSGMSCLTPTTFTPAKSGYTFVGWREDTTASSSVLTTKTMSDNPITLYAVFKKSITLTLYNGSTTATNKTGYQYYNNGAVNNPTFTVAQTAINGWTARGWSTATTGNASANYSNISNTAFSENATLYGLYYQVITLKYVSNGATNSKTGNRYYNSSGLFVNPAFTVSNPTRSGWTFKGWSTSASSTTVSYTTISNLTLTANTNLYAVWKASDANISVVSLTDLEKCPEGLTPLVSRNLTGAIDCSKYYGVTMTFSGMATYVTAEWADGRTYYLNLIGGGGTKTLASHTNSNYDKDAEDFTYNGGTVTVNFTQTSGNTYMQLQTTCNWGSGQATSMAIHSTMTCKALGRTVVY